jgi:cytochrome P450
VQLNRKRNRHLTFGTGVHRCLGAHLARMELRVALEEWLIAIPNFEREPGKVKWGSGQVRGPENVNVRIVRSHAS